MEFKAGDRIEKISGNYTGWKGTVKDVHTDGTLTVIFDGDRIPKYCDPLACKVINAEVTVANAEVTACNGPVYVEVPGPGRKKTVLEFDKNTFDGQYKELKKIASIAVNQGAYLGMCAETLLHESQNGGPAEYKKKAQAAMAMSDAFDKFEAAYKRM